MSSHRIVNKCCTALSEEHLVSISTPKFCGDLVPVKKLTF